ncbi:hypothetical protein IMZ48_49215 [Candidatus Bathyarchaeota archaeon]|nr:hypothetical protein [Candidatus Bathyarchaeota archaeon]
MSPRALQRLSHAPNFVCLRCLLTTHRPRVVAPPVQIPAPVSARWKSDMKPGRPSVLEKPKKKTPEDTTEEPEEEHGFLNIRYYEQDPTGELRQLEDQDDFARSLDGTEELGKDLEKDYQKILDIVEGKNADDPVRAQLENDLLNTIDQSRKRTDGQILESLEKTAPGVIQGIPEINEKAFRKETQRRLVRRLNGALQRADKSSKRGGSAYKKDLIPLWRAYMAARQTLALSWDSVPRPAWDLLWKLFSHDDLATNPNRLSHVASLAKDMSAANMSLLPSQQVLTIESLFVESWESDAIKNWKRCLSILGAEESSSFREFWELGVRMFCAVGDLDYANRAVEKLLSTGSDPRILMPLIRAHCEQKTEEAYSQSWEVYLRLRGLLGSNMRLEDFDQVMSFFLASNQTEYALRAFVDMMTSGTRSLRRGGRLPPSIGNKFFFGKWLKRLIGAGELSGAESVVQFMLMKQIQPAPIQINGLIGAWQRSGGVEDLEKADAMAWKMIESRLNFVAERHEGEKPRATEDTPYPRATLETFSLMAENYRLRQLHEPMMRLWQASNKAEITHDAFIVNQLLESYLQYGQPAKGMEFYRTLVSEGPVTPNPYTFMVLWKMLPANRQHVSPDNVLDETDSARSAFAEMMKFVGIWDDGEIDGQLARKILHTFRRLKDNHGFLVALAAMKNMFGYLPPEMLVLEMVVGTTNLAWDTPRARQRLRQEKQRMDTEMARMRGGEEEEMSGEERAMALYDYLIRFYTPVRGEEEEGVFDDAKLLEDAARQMGVGEVGRST